MRVTMIMVSLERYIELGAAKEQLKSSVTNSGLVMFYIISETGKQTIDDTLRKERKMNTFYLKTLCLIILGLVTIGKCYQNCILFCKSQRKLTFGSAKVGRKTLRNRSN